MNLQEASLPASLMVSWLHFHPIVQLWTLLLRRRLVRLARLLCRPLFPFLGFPPFFVAVAWRILFGLCRPPVSICDLSCGGAQLLLVPICLPISLRGVAQLWPPACPCTVLFRLCDSARFTRPHGLAFSPRILLLLTDLDFLVVIFRRCMPREF